MHDVLFEQGVDVLVDLFERKLALAAWLRASLLGELDDEFSNNLEIARLGAL